jgi:hypothetical protein
MFDLFCRVNKKKSDPAKSLRIERLIRSGDLLSGLSGGIAAAAA